MKRRFRPRATGRISVKTRSQGQLVWRSWTLLVGIFLLSITGILYYFDVKLRPSIASASKAVATHVASEALNQALTEKLAESMNKTSFVEFAPHEDKSDLTVTRFNLQAVTKLQAEATEQAEKVLGELSRQNIQLPVGHILGGSFFTALNMNLPLRLSLLGNVHSSVYADVKSVGVNQTVHILYLELSANVNVLAPLVTQPVVVRSNAPIAYIVLSGPVPNAYYGFNGQNQAGGSGTTNQPLLPSIQNTP